MAAESSKPNAHYLCFVSGDSLQAYATLDDEETSMIHGRIFVMAIEPSDQCLLRAPEPRIFKDGGSVATA